jgi:hypothetical protein
MNRFFIGLAAIFFLGLALPVFALPNPTRPVLDYEFLSKADNAICKYSAEPNTVAVKDPNNITVGEGKCQSFQWNCRFPSSDFRPLVFSFASSSGQAFVPDEPHTGVTAFCSQAGKPITVGCGMNYTLNVNPKLSDQDRLANANQGDYCKDNPYFRVEGPLEKCQVNYIKLASVSKKELATACCSDLKTDIVAKKVDVLSKIGNLNPFSKPEDIEKSIDKEYRTSCCVEGKTRCPVVFSGRIALYDKDGNLQKVREETNVPGNKDIIGKQVCAWKSHDSQIDDAPVKTKGRCDDGVFHVLGDDPNLNQTLELIARQMGVTQKLANPPAGYRIEYGYRLGAGRGFNISENAKPKEKSNNVLAKIMGLVAQTVSSGEEGNGYSVSAAARCTFNVTSPDGLKGQALVKGKLLFKTGAVAPEYRDEINRYLATGPGRNFDPAIADSLYLMYSDIAILPPSAAEGQSVLLYSDGTTWNRANVANPDLTALYKKVMSQSAARNCEGIVLPAQFGYFADFVDPLNDPRIVSFTAISPAKVGSKTAIKWSVKNVDKCILTGPNNYSVPLSVIPQPWVSVGIPVTNTGSNVFTLTCSRSSRTMKATAIVEGLAADAKLNLSTFGPDEFGGTSTRATSTRVATSTATTTPAIPPITGSATSSYLSIGSLVIKPLTSNRPGNSLVYGQSVSFAAPIANLGSVAANNIRLDWYSDAKLLKTKIFSLPPGAEMVNRPETSLALPKPLPGNHNVKMFVTFGGERQVTVLNFTVIATSTSPVSTTSFWKTLWAAIAGSR